MEESIKYNYLRKEFYELIKSDESVFDFIQESIWEGVWFWDFENPENRWLSASFWKLLGYNVDEIPLSPQAWQGIINPEDLISAKLNFKKHCENPNHPYDLILRYTHKNGFIVWIRSRGRVIREDGGKRIRMLGTCQDVSALIKSEQELQKANEKTIESEAQYRMLFENMNTGFVLFEVVQNKDGAPIDLLIITANKAFEETTGLVLANVIGKRLTSVLPGIEKDEAGWIQRYSKIALYGETANFEESSELLDKYYAVSAFKAGKKRSAVTFLDITNRKQAELKLTESEARFRKLFEDSATGMVMAGKDFKFYKANKAFCKMTGYSEKELQHFTFSDITYPADRAIGIESAHQMINGQLDKYRSEKRYLNKNGHKFWAQLTVSPTYNSRGEFLNFVGIIVDITKRKKTEGELKLLNRAVEASSVSVIITDGEGRVEYVNPYFTKITGYSLEEMLGKNPRILKAGTHTNAFYDNLWKTIKSGKEWHGDFQNQKKNGELFWEKAAISPIQDGDTNEITHFVAIKEDITELLKKEEELRRSLKEKEIMVSEIHHRVKNNLAVVSAMLQLQSFNEDNKIVLTRLKASISRIKTIANIHENLYQSESFSEIDFSKNIENLILQIFDIYDVKHDVTLTKKVDDIQLNINQAVPCSLVINEVIINSLKHAFTKHEKGSINVDCYEQNSRVKIKITDNGVGIPVDYEKKSGMGGITIIKVLTDQLDGKSRYKRLKKGTEFTLVFRKHDIRGSSSTFM